MAEPLDLSWLPATAAGCSATYIAVMGGLVTSRRVAAEIDRVQLSSRVRALRGLHSEAASEYNTARAALAEAEAEPWLAAVADNLVDTANARLGALDLRRDEPCHLADDDLEIAVDRAYDLIKKYVREFRRLRSWERWPSAWPVARGELREVQPGIEEFLASRVFVYLNPGTTTADADSKIDGLPQAAEVRAGQEEFETLRSRTHAARRQRDRLRAELSVAEQQLQLPASLPRLRRIVVALSACTAVCVGWPLAILVVGADHFPTWTRWLTLCLVLIGFVVVLLVVVDRLSWRPWRDILPSDSAESASGDTTAVDADTGSKARHEATSNGRREGRADDSTA